MTIDGNIMINETIGTLDINRIEKNMKGQWICVATNIAGTVRKSISLDIGCIIVILVHMNDNVNCSCTTNKKFRHEYQWKLWG